MSSHTLSLWASSLDVDDLENRGFVRGLLVSSVDADNLAAWLAKVLLLGLLDGEGEQTVSTLVRGDLEADDSTSTVQLTNDREGD